MPKVAWGGCVCRRRRGGLHVLQSFRRAVTVPFLSAPGLVVETPSFFFLLLFILALVHLAPCDSSTTTLHSIDGHQQLCVVCSLPLSHSSSCAEAPPASLYSERKSHLSLRPNQRHFPVAFRSECVSCFLRHPFDSKKHLRKVSFCSLLRLHPFPQLPSSSRHNSTTMPSQAADGKKKPPTVAVNLIGT